ncbi:hypothetical protein JCM8097_009236 [Rhodosporidiobolus ruineniae]
MPPKQAQKGSPSRPAKLSTDPTPLPLPALLKLLTTAGPRPPHLGMSDAMKLASKLIPKGYTSPAKLRTLTATDLARFGVDDDDLRKGFMALLGKSVGGKTVKGAKEEDGTFKRRRPGRESDLDKPLPTRAPKETVVDEDYDFEEIEYEEALAAKTVVVNRAPVMTAWATVVAEHLGFRRQEALSIAHVFTDLNASAKGVSLGILGPDVAKVEVGPSQPFVELLGRKVPVLSTQHGEWRAISKGHVADPSKAFAYVRSAFRQQLGAVIGAMRLLANSFTPADLNKHGYALYLDFRPEVEGWGKKGEVRMSTLLDLRRRPAVPAEEPALPGVDVDEGGVAKEEEEGEGRVVKVEQDEGGAVKVEPDGEGEVRVKKEEEDAEEDDGRARKRVKLEDGVKEEGAVEKGKGKADEVDEFDEFDEGIDYGAIDL